MSMFCTCECSIFYFHSGINVVINFYLTFSQFLDLMYVNLCLQSDDKSVMYHVKILFNINYDFSEESMRKWAGSAHNHSYNESTI